MNPSITIQSIIDSIESFAPRAWQESYDNSGIQVGDAKEICSGVLIALEVTEEVIEEAKSTGANLIITHHPLLFKGLKSITGKSYIERIVIEAIRSKITIYSAHTNLDKIATGVSGHLADRLELINQNVLIPEQERLIKLTVFVPLNAKKTLQQALQQAGAGEIGNYDSCSFSSSGIGQFRPKEGANPAIGTYNQLVQIDEERIEMIFPDYLKSKIVDTIKQNHPYEEPAFDLIRLENDHMKVGIGIVGDLKESMKTDYCLQWIKQKLNATVLRHSPIHCSRIQRIALAGGSCGDYYPHAIAHNADLFLTGEVKYHDFFNHEKRIIIADIGHFESESYTNELIMKIVTKKNCTFAVNMSKVKTNPIRYII